MENYDYAISATDMTDPVAEDTLYDIPEPIDQWAIEDFEQFASLIIDAE